MTRAKKPPAPASKVLLPQLAANLRRLRERADLSQEQLAARAALSPGYVSMLEAGKRGASLEMIEILAGALGGLDPLDLLKGTKP